MDELEDTIASRYRAAKQYTQGFHKIQDSMSPREQVCAIDATQSALDFMASVFGPEECSTDWNMLASRLLPERLMK